MSMPVTADAAVAKLTPLVLLAASSLPFGFVVTLLEDDFAPCLIGAAMGEIARGLYSEGKPGRLIVRLFRAGVAVPCGAVIAYLAWPIFFFVPEGFAKLCWGAIGWAAFVGVSVTPWGDFGSWMKTAAKRGLEAMAGKGDKE